MTSSPSGLSRENFPPEPQTALPPTVGSVSNWYLLLPFLSSCLYVLSYAFMRQLAETQANPVLIVGIREGLTALAGALIFFVLFFRKKAPFPTMKYLLPFFLASVGVQIFANIFQQKSYEIIGMGLATATCWTGQILWTPLFAWILLREKLTSRLLLSLLLAFAALTLLTYGAKVQKTAEEAGKTEITQSLPPCSDSAPQTVSLPEDSAPAPLTEAEKTEKAEKSEKPEKTLSRIILFIFLTAAGGALMGTASCIVRWMNQDGNSPFFAVMFMPGVGAVFLLGSDFFMNGTESYFTLSGQEYLFVILAGLANLTAYTALTVSLQCLSAVRVCVILISQLALAPLAGCLIFKEPINLFIVWGILMVVSGILVSLPRSPKTPSTSANG